MGMKEKATILLVDDDPAILLTVGDRFAAEGYAVIKAASGQAALEALENHSVTVVVLDIGLPGISGMAFLKATSHDPRFKDIPVLIFTGRANLQNFFSEIGSAGFIPKTAEPELLVRTVRNIVAQRQSLLNRGADHPVLVVENDQEVQFHLMRLLRLNKMIPRLVSDPGEILAAVSAHSPRAILLKYLLPNISGPTLARMLHEAPMARDIPVILYDDSGLHRNASIPTPNVAHFLSSPTDEDFLRSMTHVLGMN